MFPAPLVTRSLLGRAARTWIGARLLLAGLFAFANVNPLRSSPGLFTQLVALSVALCFVDVYRHRERALLGNLGLGPFTLALLFALPALLGECTLAVAHRLLA